ncbi:MAG TPA: hypothetical protein VD993_10155 [Chitinophagaceae bacterium]|nr:hypothetical protein [Chitinophagaceae bacterium]
MTLSFVLSLSILLPLTIGLIRFKTIQTSYHPFIVLIALGALTEFASSFSIRRFNTNAEVTNVFLLLECMLILYQFYRWRFYIKPKQWYWIVPAIFLVGWIVQNLVFSKFSEFSPFFHVAYSFVVVMLSINEINYLITHENRQLFRNARFLICLGFIIFFIYQILYEGSYYISSTEKRSAIAKTITSYAAYINVLTNIIFAVAIWFIPEKKFDFDRTMESLKEQQRRSGAKLPP